MRNQKIKVDLRKLIHEEFPGGFIMPFLELLCGLGLLFGILTRLSALGISLMSVSFFIAKAIVLSQNRNIECGCFGAIVDTLASVTIYMDLPLMIMALTVIWANRDARHWKGLGNRLSQEWKEKLDLIW